MNHTKLKHYFKYIFGVALMGLFALSASTNQTGGSDSITGHYYVHGSKILLTSGWFDSPITVIDSIHFASVVTVKYMSEKADTLHFFGLPGADEGESRVYNGFQKQDHIGGIISYNDFDHYRVFGSLTDNHFEINYTQPSGHYRASGNISNDTIEIHGEYFYRGIKVDYELTGEKIYNIQ